MHLALRDLFQARWSDRVHAEWIAALLRNRPDLTFCPTDADTLVSGYEHLIGQFTLTDPRIATCLPLQFTVAPTSS
jgi:hypothetical protein